MELHALKAYYTQREGLVELEDDVLSIVRQVKELYGGKVKVSWEPTTEYFVFSEECEDGTERLIFTTPELDQRALDRLMRSDARTRVYEDPYDASEREQDSLQAQLEEQGRERLREHGESLAHALKKDGVMPRLPLSVAIPRSADAD